MVVYYQAQKIFKPCLTPLVTVHGHHPKVFIMSKKRGRQHFPITPPLLKAINLPLCTQMVSRGCDYFRLFYLRISMATATIASDSNTTKAMSQNRGELNMLPSLPSMVSPRPCLFLEGLVVLAVLKINLYIIQVLGTGMDYR